MRVHPILKIRNTKHIFEATVIKKEKEGGFTNYTVALSKNWKGDLQAKDTIQFTQGMNSCAFRQFELGGQYVFFMGFVGSKKHVPSVEKQYISNCSYTEKVSDFKNWQYLENITLIEEEHALYFQKKKKFLFFTKYEQISDEIFQQYQPGEFYGPRKSCIVDEYIMRNNFFETACLIKIAHAAYYPIDNPPRKMKKFLSKISQEKLETLNDKINQP